MKFGEAIQQICSLPAEFHKGRKSAHELVHDTGIDPEMLSTESVSAVLKSKPALVSDWLQWSEDKRSSPSYYFSSEGNSYVVGHYPGNDRVEFADPIAACADFIVKEVKTIW